MSHKLVEFLYIIGVVVVQTVYLFYFSSHSLEYWNGPTCFTRFTELTFYNVIDKCSESRSKLIHIVGFIYGLCYLFSISIIGGILGLVIFK